MIISKPIGGNILTDKKHWLWLVPEKLPKWFDIINPVLLDKHQGLDNIVPYSEDILILNTADDSDSREDSDEDDDQEINIEQETNHADKEIAQ